MKRGRDIREFAQEIYRQQQAKKDFVASTQSASVVVGDEGKVTLKLEDAEAVTAEVAVSPVAHTQIREHTNIPAIYYDRIRKDAPDLYAQNVNHWFAHKPINRMFRTLDGKLRAFLSDRFYTGLENADLAEAALPAISDLNVEIISCDITDQRLYIKAVDKRINLDIPYGHKLGDGSHKFFDTCSPAIIISNSEVGLGRLKVETAIWTNLCTNLAISKGRSLSRHHVGGKHEMLGEGVYELLSNETRKKTDEATFMAVGDVIRGAFDQAKFAALIDKVKIMADQPIADPIKVVELSARRFSLNDGEKKSVLAHLINGGDLSRYGLFNAITRTAEDVESYDRAYDLERLGGEIIELPPSEWKEITEAEAMG